MATIRPFQGLRPRSEIAEQVVAPPYDVLSEAEARDIFARLPRSFIQVTRPEVNLPAGVDAHGREAYAAAGLALQSLIAEGTLEQDASDCFYLYAQKMGDHRQVALMALCSTDEYDAGTIKKHEFTRPDKEQDRVDHMLGVGAQTGLVFLAHRANAGVAEALSSAVAEPLFTITSEDGVEHSLSRVGGASDIARIGAAFEQLEALYIADGHHRSAAASRVAAERGGEAKWFLCGIFPDESLYCMAYNRLVRDLNGFTPGALRKVLAREFELVDGVAPVPTERGTFTMYLEGTWTLLRPLPGVVPEGDPVASLDVAVLQDRVLAQHLGIDDPRRDTRVEFVGGIRGAGFLSDAVDGKRAAIGFHMVPTGLDQLFRVADADRVMPPKSTWFEPKLAGGVLVNLLG
ncbi:MAG: DUF1015 domain-containing protein [Proteobacteria bacterium]|nr:DUF1015 domain-containing protein [Pseudomonadota bacterium]MCP4920809.1 DUF1015 domain-containing protein [Pseudomonadota bacterium]